MRMLKLGRVARAAKRIVAPAPCRGTRHGRFQHIENRGGTRVQVCDECGKRVGKPLDGERRAVRRVA